MMDMDCKNLFKLNSFKILQNLLCSWSLEFTEHDIYGKTKLYFYYGWKTVCTGVDHEPHLIIVMIWLCDHEPADQSKFSLQK